MLDIIYDSTEAVAVKKGKKQEPHSSTIKAYKFKRLTFGQGIHFWKMWNDPKCEGLQRTTLLYKMAVRMSLAKFTAKESTMMLNGWHKKHGLKLNVAQNELIVASAREFTLEHKRRQKREEMRRYRASLKAKKQAAKATEVSANVA